MAFLAGENITAGRLSRLQPKTYWAQASAAQTSTTANSDITGATVTFTTEVANAQVDIFWSADHRTTAAATGIASTRALIDGVSASPTFTIFTGGGTVDKGTHSANWVTTLAATGSHTIKLQVSQNTNQQIQIYTTLRVVVTEVV